MTNQHIEVPSPGDAPWRCWAVKASGARCNNKRPDKVRGGRWFTCAAHRFMEDEAVLVAERAGWSNPRTSG